MSLPCHSECNEESAEGFLIHLEKCKQCGNGTLWVLISIPVKLLFKA